MEVPTENDVKVWLVAEALPRASEATTYDVTEEYEASSPERPERQKK